MAIVMAAVLLAGCGQDASKETKEAGAEEAVAEEAAAEEAGAEDAGTENAGGERRSLLFRGIWRRHLQWIFPMRRKRP